MGSKVVFGWGLDRLEAEPVEGGRVGFRLFVSGRIEGEFELSVEEIRRLLEEGGEAVSGGHRISDGRTLKYRFENRAGGKVRMEMDRLGLSKLAAPLEAAA